MTEKERIEKTYQKIRQKHPDVTDRAQLEELAIREDKTMTLLRSFGWLAGGILSLIVFARMPDDSYESVRLIFMMMGGSGIFEFFRTLGKYARVEQLYRPVLTVRHEGELTRELIVSKGGRKLKKAEDFFLWKLPLADKEDELDTGTDNETHHSYYLYFQAGDRHLKYRVSRSTFFEAVIGAEYYVVLTEEADGSGGEICGVYQSSNWTIGADLMPFFRRNSDGNASVEAPEVSPVFQAPAVHQVVQTEKPKKGLAIASIVLSVVDLLLPMILAAPLQVVALVLAIIAVCRSRYSLNITALVLSIVVLVLVALIFVMTLMSII